MPTPSIAPALHATPHAEAGAAPFARKARFWDRIAPKYAAEPIADMAGYEATLQRVQALLPPAADVLEVGCGTGSTAMRLAPFTGRMLATDVAPGMIAIARERLAAQPVPQLGFALADPAANALPAAILIASFIGTGSSFLAFAIIAAKRGKTAADYPSKGIYYLGGLTEGAETIAIFAAMCLFPFAFPALAYIFATACVLTTLMRWHQGWTAFR